MENGAYSIITRNYDVKNECKYEEIALPDHKKYDTTINSANNIMSIYFLTLQIVMIYIVISL
jgi:hypothetical protein